MKYPRSIQNLINSFTKFPTVGPKTAERYVFYLLNQKEKDLKDLANTIIELKKNLHICKVCFSVADSDPCYICTDTKRNNKLLCIVSNTRDMQSIESTNEFNGIYHVLGGNISSIDNIRPEDLTIDKLINKLHSKNIEEIILALNPTIEGETTSLYLNKLIKEKFAKIKITRLAKGLSSGSNLEYADALTLSNAIKYRNEL